jgi:nicotinamide N-methyltransferase
MENMEQERAEMVAEVEAQIEKALASMAVDIDDSDEDDDSRPGSRMSSSSVGRLSRPNSRTSRSRRTSDAATRKQLRSFGTESTLVETYEILREEAQGKLELAKEEVIEEEDEAPPQSPTKPNRFSASGGDGQQDGMTAVDEGISERSDRIAAKVLQIQQKVESVVDHSCMTQALTFSVFGFSWRMRSQRIVKGTGSPHRALRARVKVLRDAGL